MKTLSNKVILLTGGADGIGLACAHHYAAAGATVCIADRSDQQPFLGEGRHSYYRCDISQEQEVRSLFAFVTDQYGRLDAIHNNAGVASPSKPLHTTTIDEWDLLMRVNLKSIYLTTRFGIDLLRAAKGAILHTSSLTASIGQDNHAAYVATKGAVNALTKAMALDYAADGIRVNAVAPAAVNTPMLAAWMQEQPNPAAMQRYLDQLHPLGGLPAADVIAAACVFLLSDAARFVTGCILPVSGGAELGYRTLIDLHSTTNL